MGVTEQAGSSRADELLITCDTQDNPSVWDRRLTAGHST
jgi:hypothetical protein